MACCDDSEKPVTTAVGFVLPDLQLINSSESIVGEVEADHEIAIFRSILPLSPPPQIVAL
jgi:hypothetical protein